MPDYGHPIRFGTFITPTNQPASTPVELAVLSEQLGYDLVTFQDHPYQAAFHDTWTLLTWVAAQTERIEVSGNVLNLPLRPPAVLARAAASLDLLSDGRFALGIGSGGFWDAIESVGGRRLTPGEGVSALSEALDLIKGIWDADQRRILTLEGDFYSVRGAKRGPRPAHPIPVWLGAYKPRMLRLVGEKADGWLPSLPYLKDGDLTRGNAAIDQAAQDAGRDPAEIVRLLNLGGQFSATAQGPFNGPPEQWVEELLPLVIEEGMSTFIVMGDDPGMLVTFAEEVAPALRDAVSEERQRHGTAAAAGRSAIALSQRVAGIQYDAIPSSLVEAAIEPGDFAYSTVRSTYMRGGSPGLVLPVRTPEQISDALSYARLHDVPLSLRSRGHGMSGRSTNDGGIVIDLSRLDKVEVLDPDRRLVRIGAGARWQDVAQALAPYGLAISSGDYGGVGVGGLATAGGVGMMVREHGLTIDHVRAVDVVTADGAHVRAATDENPDLLWAMRGAGANFGVATSFEIEASPVGKVGWVHLYSDASDLAGFLRRWGELIESSPRDVTCFLVIGAPRQGRIVAWQYAVVASDDPDVVIERMQPFADLAPLLDQRAQLTTYADLISNAGETPHTGWGEPHSRSGLLEAMSPAFAAEAAEMVRSGDVHFFQVRAMGGAVGDLAPDATAFPHRSAQHSVVAMSGHRQRLDDHWDRLKPFYEGMYLSFETRQAPALLEDAFGANLPRLRELKQKWDPEGVFRDNFWIH